MPSKAYIIDEDGNVVFFRLEWGVRQYKSFKSEEEARGHLKTLSIKELENGYRITKHTMQTIENHFGGIIKI